MSGERPIGAFRSRLPASVGDLIDGKYRVEKVLGVGGMGVVLGAMHVQLGHRVALKFLLPEAAVDEIARVRFDREGRALAQLESEHVARVIDVESLADGTPYIVLERLVGRDLADVMDARGALPIDEAVDHILEACDAIAEAHAVGIIHRDLKPENLFLTDRADGTQVVKVLDFGISKVEARSLAFSAPRDTAVTRTANLVGSPMYMSPEQLRSARDVDGRSDVWSLGITLYELVCGQAPYPWGTVPEVCAAVLKDEPTPLSARLPDVPPALEAAIARALERDRARRWPDVVSFACAIAPFGGPRAADLVERIARVGHRTPVRRDEPIGRNLASEPTLGAAPSADEADPTADAPREEPLPSMPEPVAMERRPEARRPTRVARAGGVLAAVGVAVLAVGLRPPAPTIAASHLAPFVIWTARAAVGGAFVAAPAAAPSLVEPEGAVAPPGLARPSRPAQPVPALARARAFEYRK